MARLHIKEIGFETFFHGPSTLPSTGQWPTIMSSVRGLFREFLETSTIHGLQHIGGESQKLGKLIWVVIVACGFSIAALLIWDSVKGWEESPVSTSVETFPISEVAISFLEELEKGKAVQT